MGLPIEIVDGSRVCLLRTASDVQIINFAILEEQTQSLKWSYRKKVKSVNLQYMLMHLKFEEV